MKEQDRVLQYDKEDITFRTGGTRAFKIIGIVLFLVGLLLVHLVREQSGSNIGNPVYGYFAGSLFALAGVVFFFYKSERRFDLASQRWQVSRSVLRFKSYREGSFKDLSTVEVDCSNAGDASNIRPYLYEVKVTAKDGYNISIRKDLALAHVAFYIANELTEKLSLPLENKAVGKNYVVEMIPADDVPEPPRRFSTSSFDGDMITFSIPSPMKLEKKVRISLIITTAIIAAMLLTISAIGVWGFWDWFSGWLESGQIKELRNALIVIPFIILPILGGYWVINRVFRSRETLKVSPSGVTHHDIHGSWSQVRQLPKARITAIKLRVNTSARKPWVVNIMICAGLDTFLVGRGLPEEENIWIASQLRRILGLQ